MLQLIDRAVMLTRTLMEASKKMRNAELQLTVADLLLTTADLKTELVDMQTKLAEARNEVRYLKERLKMRGKVEFRDGFYHLRKPVRGFSEGPFCATCFEEDGLLITVRNIRRERLSDGTSETVGARCPRCIRRLRSGG